MAENIANVTIQMQFEQNTKKFMDAARAMVSATEEMLETAEFLSVSGLPGESPSDLLQQLMDRCAYGVTLEINPHRPVHETAKEHLIDEARRWPDEPLAPTETLNRMIETGQIVELSFNPRNSITHIRVWHYDLTEALREALKTLDEYDATHPKV